ncbi:MAG: hypothetical protein A2173_12000 [Planctomycetes bacterium RBG_13_44_8b]|nr:MAG: hypothetical protein A2173_12000 [Planctomycetes bacterium RBG_13_44_8b]
MYDLDNTESLRNNSYPSSCFDQFCQDALRGISLIYLAWLMLALVMSLFVYISSPGFSLPGIRLSIMVYYLVLTVHVIFRIRSGGRRNILAPDIIFIVLYTAFHLGYVTLFALNLIPSVSDIFFYQSSVSRSLFVVNLGLIGFICGYEVLGSTEHPQPQRGLITVPTWGWCVFGMFMTILGVVMHLGSLAVIGISGLEQYGYGAVSDVRQYYGTAMAMVASESNTVVLFGAIIYMVASVLRYGKLFRSKLLFASIIGMLFLYTMEGDRGPILYLGIAVIIVRHYLVKAVKVRYIISMALLLLVLFGAVGVIRRAKTAFTVAAKLEEYKYSKSAGLVDWRSPFIEMGGSFRVTSITCEDVPKNEPYWLGKSYLSAALHIIPFLEGYCARKGWLGPYSFWPSNWVTFTTVGTKAGGLAFTVATEGYLNFGFPGAFMEVFACGLFIRWLTKRFSKNPSASAAFIMFGCFVFSLAIIRNHIQLVTGWFFQIFVIAYFLKMFYGDESEPVFEDYLQS